MVCWLNVCRYLSVRPNDTLQRDMLVGLVSGPHRGGLVLAYVRFLLDVAGGPYSAEQLTARVYRTLWGDPTMRALRPSKAEDLQLG